MRAYHALWRDKNGLSRDEYGQLFDERCVMWLQYILHRTDAKIVISSTWRCKELQYMKNLWQSRGLPGEIIDVTPTMVDERLCIQYPHNGRADRGYEIQQWIEEWGPEKYVILDDDSDMLPHQTFVRCKTDIGITMIEADIAIAHLNGEPIRDLTVERSVATMPNQGKPG